MCAARVLGVRDIDLPKHRDGEAPRFLQKPIVVEEGPMKALLSGQRRVTCIPLAVPKDMQKGDVVYIETKSRKYVVREGTKYHIVAAKPVATREGERRFRLASVVVMVKVGEEKPEVTLAGALLLSPGRPRRSKGIVI